MLYKDVNLEDFMTKEKNYIDLYKFIGSIMIFAMHASAFQDFGKMQFLWELLSRWAVPVFFMVSSYFLFSSNGGAVTESHIKKYIKRIGLLYFSWFLYNIPSTLYIRIIAKHSYTLLDWANFIKESLLSSTFTGSWYLVSSVFCAVLLYFLKKRLSMKGIFAIAFGVELLCIFSSAYGNALPEKIQAVLAFLDFPLNLFGGLFYFSVGLYFAEHPDAIHKFKEGPVLFVAILSCLLYFLEIYMTQTLSVYKTTDQAFLVIPFSISIFILGMRSTIPIRNARSLRKISTIVYCAQGNILLAKSAVSKIFGIHSSILLFAFCVVSMAFVIFLVFALQKKYPAWAKYLT